MEHFDEDLTEEERGILGKLADPDAARTDNYKWDEEIQREIIGLLLNDRFFTLQSSGLIKPGYFTNECHQAIARIVFAHFQKYNSIPNKTQLFSELKETIQNREPKYAVHYLGELNTIAEYYIPGIESRDYYLDKITNFAKGMSMKIAFGKSLEEWKKAPEREETWVKIETMLREAMSIDRNFDIGLDYFKSFEERYERRLKQKETGDMFVTGFPLIDEALSCGGLTRGEIGSVIGLPGTGKSIFLVNAAIANIHRGKKVLYVSLEIDQDKCAERFDAQFANPQPFGEGSNGITIKNLLDKKEVLFDALRDYVADKDDQRLLVVKQFSAGSMDMSMFRAYFAQIKILGFLPDLVIIDYVGEMKDYPGMPTWESRQKLVRDLRGFAVDEQVCMLTAMQPDGRSRETVKLGGVIDDDNLADSKGQNRPLDALWSINQLNDEKECGLARIFVIKHRDGKSRFTTHIEFNYDTLKMRQISESRYNSIYKKYKHEKDQTVSSAMKESEIDKVNKIVGGGNKKSFLNDAGYKDAEDAPPQEGQ